MALTDLMASLVVPPGCRVVVVDDVDVNVALLTRILRGAGADLVDGYVDARAALTACADTCPDVLLLDLHMPHLDGAAFLGELRTLLPADEFLPVIMLTADTSLEAKERALVAGATEFVAKPFDPAEVLLRVRNLFEMRQLYVRAQDHNRLLSAQVEQQRSRQRELVAARRAVTRRVSELLERPNTMRTVFQPIVDLDTGAVVGAEALTRFDAEPNQPPDVWFAEAGEVGLGEALELRAIEIAIGNVGRLPAGAFVALNVSPTVASSPRLREQLADIPGGYVVLELTEHDKVREYTKLWEAFDELRGQGVRIAVDDAGAGFAGLQHILHLRPDIVKLDKDLTREIHRDPARRALVTALVGFTSEIGAALVAEGIEELAALEVLRDIGVSWGQGYYFARPGPLPFVPDEFAAEVRASSR
jgi:EAL domain-containing protein (putative c-di-GMP-specific phosphodiesterase class I)